jgi:hypothetical protein
VLSRLPDVISAGTCLGRRQRFGQLRGPDASREMIRFFFANAKREDPAA